VVLIQDLDKRGSIGSRAHRLSVGHKSFFRRDIRHGPTGDPFWAGPCVPTEKASKGRGTRAVTTKM
jgi:hypothetical protein